jgi:dCMP deaminase
MVFMDPNEFLHSDPAISMDKYYMNIAMAVRRKANCFGRKVGAILVRENRLISTGYNGTPEGAKNCLDGGCVRCKNPKKYKRSTGYDVCICVHAEQNALITAARFGIPVEGAIAYSTMRPCFDCTKSLFQAKVRGIYYLHEWASEIRELHDQYELLQARFPERFSVEKFATFLTPSDPTKLPEILKFPGIYPKISHLSCSLLRTESK